MSLADQLSARISDLDSRIESTKKELAERVARLLAEKQALLKALSLLTPDAEQSLDNLRRIGLIEIKS